MFGILMAWKEIDDKYLSDKLLEMKRKSMTQPAPPTPFPAAVAETTSASAADEPVDGIKAVAATNPAAFAGWACAETDLFAAADAPVDGPAVDETKPDAQTKQFAAAAGAEPQDGILQGARQLKRSLASA